MATINDTHPTLADVIARTGPDKKIGAVAELLNQTNEMLDDIVWLEANDTTSHTSIQRIDLPEVYWRKYGEGIPTSKSRTAKIKDSIGMLEALSPVDSALLGLNGNGNQFRMTEDMAFIEAMNQGLASTIVYGDTDVYPERFLGLHPRFADLTGGNADNIVVADGSASGADQTSIWLVVWGPNTVFGTYPKGSKAGLSVQDLGQQLWDDGTGKKYLAKVSHFKWDCGMVVKDWRYVARGANIDLSRITANTSTSGSDLIDVMTQMVEKIPNLNMGRACFYVHPTIRSFLRRQINNKVAASTLTMEQIAGRKVVTFDGIPVRRVDAILKTESPIT